MKDFKQNLKWFLLSLMFVAGTGYTWGATTTDTYTFTSKSWAASPSNWTSGKDGNQLTSGQGVQVTTGVSGANATSPTSYTNVTKIVVTYCTNATKGAGSIAVQVGSNAAVSQSVTTNGGTTLRTLEYTLGSAQSGNVKLTVTCTTNSIYINSIAITYDSGTPKTDSEVTFPQESYSTSYPGSFSAPTATVSNASTHAAISGATVTYSSNNSTVTSVNSSNGAVTLNGSGTAVITATDAGNTPDAPSLTPSCTFWPKTTETPSITVTIAPTTTGSTVRYTTNGSDPTTTNGNIVISSTDITITETTTVKAIAYVGTSTSGISFSTYTLGETVNSIAAFKTLAEGTEARLYLSPENNARVLHVSGSEIYVRDNTGAICIYLASSLQNPVPQHDWHVAGWIIGKNEPFNGLPELKATSNTTTNYMAFAAPVTEEATEPVTISPNDFDNYKADWVKICDLRAESNNDVTDDAGNTFKFYNKYSLNSDSYYQDLYDYALVDLAGLAVPYGTDKEIVPIYYNNKRPIIYVIDENKSFTSPNNDIKNVTVRLVRTLSNENWNTFCIPFDLQNFYGSVRKYEHADGQTMVFVEDYIEAGKPYLVKPSDPIENPVYENITLTATPPQNVEEGNYSFNGIYEPTNIYTEDRTNLFLKTDGYLYYPLDESKGRLKGMRAYFVAPAGSSGVKVMVDDNLSTMIEVIPGELVPIDSDIYTISGQHAGKSMEGLPRGIYIMNGKKLLIK